MTITAQSIFLKAQTVSQDQTGVRWPASEAVGWFNMGQREIAIHKPSASVSNANLTLTTSTSKQTIPATAIMLIDVVRNMGVGGSTPGRAIRVVTREVLDNTIPNWHISTPASEVIHFVFDSRDQKNFYVWPRPNGAIQVEAITCVNPTEVTESAGALVGNLALDDIYEGPMLDYLLYRTYLKDAEYAGNAARAVAHYQAFANALGIKAKIEALLSPTSNSFFNPNNPGFGKATQAAQ